MRRERAFIILEDIAIVLAIASLWPTVILELESAYWWYFMYLMGGAMIVIAVRRWKRFKRLREGPFTEKDNDQSSDIDNQ